MNGHVRDRGKRADGTTKWQARYNDPNDPRRRIEKTFRTKSAAQRWLTKQQAAILDGDNSDPRRGDRPFQQLTDTFRETRFPQLAPKTQARYTSVLNVYLLPEFGTTPANRITREVLKRFFARLQRQPRVPGGAPLSPGTIQKIHTVLSAVLTEAVENRVLRTNEAQRLKLPAPRTKDMTVLTAKEVRALAEAHVVSSGSTTFDGYRVAIYVAAYTGVRSGELWALRRQDVDLLARPNPVLHVRQTVKRDDARPDADPSTIDLYGREVGPPKNERPRTIALPSWMRDMLNEHLTDPIPLPGGTGPDHLVFHTPGGSAVRHTLFMRRVFKPTVKGTENEDPKKRRAPALPAPKQNLRFHDLRHTCASLLIHNGASIKLVQERLGHSDPAMTLRRYQHLFPSADAALVDALESVYASAGPDDDKDMEVGTAGALAPVR